MSFLVKENEFYGDFIVGGTSSSSGGVSVAFSRNKSVEFRDNLSYSAVISGLGDVELSYNDSLIITGNKGLYPISGVQNSAELVVSGGKTVIAYNGNVAFTDNARRLTSSWGMSYVLRSSGGLDMTQNDSVVFRNNATIDPDLVTRLGSLSVSGPITICTKQGKMDSSIVFYDPVSLTNHSGNHSGGISLNKDGAGRYGAGRIVFSGLHADEDLLAMRNEALSQKPGTAAPDYSVLSLAERRNARTNKLTGNVDVYGGKLQIEDSAIVQLMGNLTIQQPLLGSPATLSVGSSGIRQVADDGTVTYEPLSALQIAYIYDNQLYGSYALTFRKNSALKFTLTEAASSQVPVIDISGRLCLEANTIPLDVLPEGSGISSGTIALLRVGTGCDFVNAKGESLSLTYSAESKGWFLGDTPFSVDALPWVTDNDKLSWIGNTLYYNMQAYYWAAEGRKENWTLGTGKEKKIWSPNPQYSSHVDYADGFHVFFEKHGTAIIQKRTELAPISVTIDLKNNAAGVAGNDSAPVFVWDVSGNIEIKSKLELRSGILQVKMNDDAQFDLTKTTISWSGEGGKCPLLVIEEKKDGSTFRMDVRNTKFEVKRLGETDVRLFSLVTCSSVDKEVFIGREWLFLTDEGTYELFVKNTDLLPEESDDWLVVSKLYNYNAYQLMADNAVLENRGKSKFVQGAAYKTLVLYQSDMYYVESKTTTHSWLGKSVSSSNRPSDTFVAYDAEKHYYNEGRDESPIDDRKACALNVAVNMVMFWLDRYGNFAKLRSALPSVTNSEKGSLSLNEPSASSSNMSVYDEMYRIYTLETKIGNVEKSNKRTDLAVAWMLTGQLYPESISKKVGIMTEPMKKYGKNAPFFSSDWVYKKEQYSDSFEAAYGTIYTFVGGTITPSAFTRVIGQAFSPMVTAPVAIGYQQTYANNFFYKTGSHVVTCYGYQTSTIDGKEYVTKLWVTDSDDESYRQGKKDHVKELNIVYGKDGRVYISDPGNLNRISCLNYLSFFTDPETLVKA